MDPAVSRMTGATLFLLVVAVASSVWRHDSVEMTVAYAVAIVAAGGFVIAVHRLSRRHR